MLEVLILDTTPTTKQLQLLFKLLSNKITKHKTRFPKRSSYKDTKGKGLKPKRLMGRQVDNPKWYLDEPKPKTANHLQLH